MIRVLLLLGIGIATFAGAYHLLPSETRIASVDVSSDGAEDADNAPPRIEDGIVFELRPGSATSSAEHAQFVRDVTPDTMTAGPRVTSAVTRIEPPAPPPQDRSERLFNPIVIDAGTIKARGRDIHLAGIDTIAFDKRCGEGDAAWPCGRMARAALRSFIRGRAIECVVPAGADAIPDPAMCSVAGADISEWLVAQGWAKHGAGPFAEIETAARDAQRGVWGKGRPDGSPEVASR